METVLKWLRTSAFGLGIAAALAFGGYQALASPRAPTPCDWNPPDFGPCSSQAECQDRCDNYYGEDEYLGFCEYSEPPGDYCCICVDL